MCIRDSFRSDYKQITLSKVFDYIPISGDSTIYNFNDLCDHDF